MAKWAVGDQENVAAAITMSKLPWFAFAPLNFVSTFFRSIGQHLLVNNIIRLEQVNGLDPQPNLKDPHKGTFKFALKE